MNKLTIVFLFLVTGLLLSIAANVFMSQGVAVTDICEMADPEMPHEVRAAIGDGLTQFLAMFVGPVLLALVLWIGIALALARKLNEMK